MRLERIAGLSVHRIPSPVYSSSPSCLGRATRTHLLPLVLLVAIVVGTLVVITLSQMAVMHRFATQQPATNSYAEQQQQHPGPSSSPSNAPTSGGGPTTPDVPFKLEPLISRTVTPIDVHALHLKGAANERRVATIVRRMATNGHVSQCPGDEMCAGTNSVNDSSSEDSLDGDQSAAPQDTSNCAQTKHVFRPYCPKVPPDLVGELHADNVTHSTDLNMLDVELDNSYVCHGGWWMPSLSTSMTLSCQARHRVAIVVPYRDRLSHLVTLLAHLHPILQRQQLHYRIFVAEQTSNGTFNKGTLMNAAFEIAMTEGGHFQCFVFHDVDLIPEDDRNMYSCPPSPRHMSVGVDEFQYVLPYNALVGGVFSITTEHFLEVNGYSNMYWGWGGEDDDLSYRLSHVGLSITRPSVSLARYRMIKHVKRKPLVWKIRGKLLNTAKKRMKFDGLNSLKYTLVSHNLHPLYTNLTIDVGVCPPTICGS